MVSVGFGKNINEHQRLSKCVGSENIIGKSVDNTNDLYQIMKVTIFDMLMDKSRASTFFDEEIGHLHRTR